MIKGKNDHNIILNDKGSTIITVIVAIAFVTILTSIILGTSVMNVRMKGIDKRTKDDFYFAEKSLNDIYTGIGQDLAEKAAQEYETAFNKVGTVEGSNDYNLSETAEKNFREAFVTTAKAFADALTVTDLQKYVLSASKGKVDSITDVEYQTKNGAHTDSVSDAYRVAIKGVRVYVEDSNHFRSVITTDIIIDIPGVDFLGTNADVSDYVLIANEGLYINGNAWITGNVYAGVHEDKRSDSTFKIDDYDFEEDTDKYSRGVYTDETHYTGVFGGINIKDGKAEFKSNYIVSKGDVTLSSSPTGGASPKLKVYTPSAGGDANLANMWVTSIRTIKKADITPLTTPIPSPLTEEPTIDIDANVFALNDLALNANNTSVVLKGNYYGYNDKTLPNLLGLKTGRDDSESSAIIVNGTNSYLDMKDIRNFVLMGKAYIDFTSDDATKAAATAKQVVPTAEGVAIKTNQQLYLVPNDFLDEPNPMLDTVGTDFHLSVPQADYERWFGYKYLRTYDPTGVSSTEDMKYTHAKYAVTLNEIKPSDGTNVVVYYDYLMFDENKTWKPQTVGGKTTYVPNVDDEGNFLDLGTNNSISSKAAFFYEIMNSENDPVVESDPATVQPSAYRLKERIKYSMENAEYFDLKKCVVGTGTDDAHYYAKNAVINYERDAHDEIQTNVFKNTEGMLRYATYTDYLYKRYMLLCTRLDAKEKVLLDADPAPGKGTTAGDWPEWKVKYSTGEPAPIGHYVMRSNLTTMD
ncbi:MAG: hypothetical protein J5367_07135, partial [Lachnospiraceae bacterium]|nr:hypothetical protein [Lachnospiraceae bacterium]